MKAVVMHLSVKQIRKEVVKILHRWTRARLSLPRYANMQPSEHLDICMMAAEDTSSMHGSCNVSIWDTQTFKLETSPRKIHQNLMRDAVLQAAARALTNRTKKLQTAWSSQESPQRQTLQAVSNRSRVCISESTHPSTCDPVVILNASKIISTSENVHSDRGSGLAGSSSSYTLPELYAALFGKLSCVTHKIYLMTILFLDTVAMHVLTIKTCSVSHICLTRYVWDWHRRDARLDGICCSVSQIVHMTRHIISQVEEECYLDSRLYRHFTRGACHTLYNTFPLDARLRDHTSSNIFRAAAWLYRQFFLHDAWTDIFPDVWTQKVQCLSFCVNKHDKRLSSCVNTQIQYLAHCTKTYLKYLSHCVKTHLRSLCSCVNIQNSLFVLREQSS